MDIREFWPKGMNRFPYNSPFLYHCRAWYKHHVGDKVYSIRLSGTRKQRGGLQQSFIIGDKLGTIMVVLLCIVFVLYRLDLVSLLIWFKPTSSCWLVPHILEKFECHLSVTSIATSSQLSVVVKMLLQYCGVRSHQKSSLYK